jgi:hypothetical protein
VSIDLTTINRRTNELIQGIGRAVMHQMYPNDFEYYMIALELVNGAGNTIDYFAFPVLPSAITKSENKRINIKKAYKSILILTSTAYTPQDISIRGNFGRGFKILIGAKDILNGIALSVSTKAGIYELNQTAPVPQFSQFVKTGYGAIKILQSIIHKSDGSDSSGPYRLYLYNFALGESYLVVVPAKALTLEQNDSNMNMIWNYTLNLTTIAPLDLIKNAVSVTSNTRILQVNVMQSNVNSIGQDILNYVSRILK